MQSFCYHCGRKLAATYSSIEDPIGNIHIVHKACKEATIESFTQTTYKTPFELENPELFREDYEI